MIIFKLTLCSFFTLVDLVIVNDLICDLIVIVDNLINGPVVIYLINVNICVSLVVTKYYLN